MTNPRQNLEVLREAKEDENIHKGHKYKLIKDFNEDKENGQKLVNKHNPTKKNIETIILSLDKKGTNFLESRKINMEEIIGTSRVDLEHLSWKDSLIFLQQFASFLPMKEINVPKFLEKMETNNFIETLKLIEYPKNSRKYYVLDGTNRIVLARNLGLEWLYAEVFSV